MTTETTAQTVQLSEVNPTPEKKENFFEKGVKSFVGFIAKATGQPDPEKGTSSASPSFFEKLVSSTQNLLDKTQDFASKAVEKTNAVIDKGIDLGEKVKSRAETAVNSGVNFGKNLKTTMTEWAQKFTENPLQAAGEIGKGVVSSTTHLGKDLGEQVKDAGSASLNQLKEGAQTLGEEVQQVGEQLPLAGTPATNFVADLKGKGEKALDATKEIWKNLVTSTTDFVKNPIEHFDFLTGKGNDEAPTVQTETENTTALENLEKAA